MHLGLRRQLGRHVVLAPAQDEGPHALRQQLRAHGLAVVLDRLAPQAREAGARRRGSPASGSRTAPTARPGGSPAACRSGTGGGARPAGAAPPAARLPAFLTVCASSSTTQVPGLALQRVDVAPQQRVGGEAPGRARRCGRSRPARGAPCSVSTRSAGAMRAASACQLAISEVGSTTSAGPVEAAGLLFDQQMRQHLRRLAEAHVVGQDAGQMLRAQVLQPGHALALVVAQLEADSRRRARPRRHRRRHAGLLQALRQGRRPASPCSCQARARRRARRARPWRVDQARRAAPRAGAAPRPTAPAARSAARRGAGRSAGRPSRRRWPSAAPPAPRCGARPGRAAGSARRRRWRRSRVALSQRASRWSRSASSGARSSVSPSTSTPRLSSQEPSRGGSRSAVRSCQLAIRRVERLLAAFVAGRGVDDEAPALHRHALVREARPHHDLPAAAPAAAAPGRPRSCRTATPRPATTACPGHRPHHRRAIAGPAPAAAAGRSPTAHRARRLRRRDHAASVRAASQAPRSSSVGFGRVLSTRVGAGVSQRRPLSVW